MDTLGKYNMHRFMNLLGELGIPHAVLYDEDNGKMAEVDKTIVSARNNNTIGIDSFPVNLEQFLGIPEMPQSEKHRKPQHIMWHLHQGKIDEARIEALITKVKTLLGV